MGALEETPIREELKSLVDDLTETELRSVRRYIQFLHFLDDPVALSLARAPADDEPITEEDRDAIEESNQDLAAGRVVTLEQLKRELGT